MTHEMSHEIKKSIAEKVVAFIEQATCTKTDLAKILNMQAPMLSMVANVKHLDKISPNHWETFRDIYNGKIYMDGHLIKDSREFPTKVINMMEYKSKFAHGGGNRLKKEPIQFDKEKHTNAVADPIPPGDALSPEMKNLLKFLDDHPAISAEKIISVWNQYHDYEPPTLPPKKSALTEEDVEMLKKFGMNFKKGIYLVHGDTVVEMLAPVDLHNILSQIIRDEFERLEWEITETKTIKAVVPGK